MEFGPDMATTDGVQKDGLILLSELWPLYGRRPGRLLYFMCKLPIVDGYRIDEFRAMIVDLQSVSVAPRNERSWCGCPQQMAKQRAVDKS